MRHNNISFRSGRSAMVKMTNRVRFVQLPRGPPSMSPTPFMARVPVVIDQNAAGSENSHGIPQAHMTNGKVQPFGGKAIGGRLVDVALVRVPSNGVLFNDGTLSVSPVAARSKPLSE